jgi:hypothetical protein
VSWDTSAGLSLGLDEAKLRSGTAQIYAPGAGAPRRVSVVWIPSKECFEVRSLNTPRYNPDRVMLVRHCYDFSEVLTAFEEEARTALSMWAAKVMHPNK